MKSTNLSTPQSPYPRKRIVKSNAFVNAQYQLTPTQMKIIYLMALQIKPDDKDFQPYRLSVNEFRKELGQDNNQALYTRLVEIVGDMMKKVIMVQNEEGEIEQFPLITFSKHKLDGQIEIRFVPEVRSSLLNIKERFTILDYNAIFSLKHTATMRFYEFLAEYRKLKTRTMEVAEIKKKLDIGSKYKSYNMFKKRIIESALTELKENDRAEFYFDYREIKKGRKVNAIRFNIIEKKKEKNSISVSNKGTSTRTVNEKEYNEEEIYLLLEKVGLTDHQIPSLLSDYKHDLSNIPLLIEGAIKRDKEGKVNNLTAYIHRVIASNSLPPKQSSYAVEKSEKQLVDKQKAEDIRNKNAVIASLLTNYDESRKEIIEGKVKEFSEDRYEELVEYLKKMPAFYHEGMIMNGKIIPNHSKFNLFVSLFCNSELPEYKEGVIDHIKHIKGWEIKEDENISNRFVYVSNLTSVDKEIA